MPTQYCTNHKNQETLRICGRCERPFCPDCLVATPVGGRCRECARGPKIARMRVVWWRWPLVLVAAGAGGALGTVAMGMSMWFMLIVSIVAGQFIASAVLWASGRNPGTAVAVVATAAVAVGALGGLIEWVGFGVFQIAGAALMAGTAYMRLR